MYSILVHIHRIYSSFALANVIPLLMPEKQRKYLYFLILTEMSSNKKTLITTLAVTGTGLTAYRYTCPWISYDIQTIRQFYKAQRQALKDQADNRYLIDKFEETVVNNPDKTFVVFEGREFSYQIVDCMANKVANVAATWGLQQGDTVALMMANEPAFVWTFLGKNDVFLYLRKSVAQW